jgi:choline dehydrogenase-like flavoprotein
MGAFSFSYLPLKEDAKLTALLNKTLEETTNKGLKAQYEFIARQIKDANEATATVLLTRKQRYTPPSNPAPGNYMTILAMLSHPFSRGYSHITSQDSREKPEIKFNYLTHPLDTLILSRHMQQINHLLTLPPLSSCLKPHGHTLPPSYSRSPNASIEEMKPFLSQYAATNYHPTGTCAMMGEEMDGVVGADLRVHGVGNVRVCDASVVPVAPRGNVLSCVYAVAGKGVDVILRDLGVEV